MRWLVLALITGMLPLAITGCGGGSASAQSNPAVVGEALTEAIPYLLTKLPSGLYLFVSDTGTGWEPWVTDGTTAGTFQLAETSAGMSGGYQTGMSPFQVGKEAFVVHGNEAFFVTYPGDAWKTDGTMAGTVKVVDLSPDGYEFVISTTSLDGDEFSVGGCLAPLAGGDFSNCKVVTIDLG